jgi:RND family efflux transporter MFP subunit
MKEDMRAARRAEVLLAAAAAALLAPAGLHAGEFDCVIEPRRVIELRAPLEGLIDKINVDRGDVVKRGQDLVVLDMSVDRASAAIARHRSVMDGAVRSGESRVEFSSSKLGRVQNLEAQKFMSAQARDEAATEQRLAQAELQDARDNRKLAELELARQMEVIRLKTIRSPINGIVVERLLHPGEFAEAGVGRKPILKLAEIDTLHVEVLLPVAAYGQVRPGMEVDVLPEIPNGARYPARVRVIDRLVDAGSGTFGVRMELENSQRRMPAGIRCKAIFNGIDLKPPRPVTRKSNG